MKVTSTSLFTLVLAKFASFVWIRQTNIVVVGLTLGARLSQNKLSLESLVPRVGWPYLKKLANLTNTTVK